LFTRVASGVERMLSSQYHSVYFVACQRDAVSVKKRPSDLIM